MRIRPALAILAALAPVTAQQPTDLKPLPPERQVGFASIDPELCREWLTYLSSDELEGRATGHPGYKQAAEFVAAKFKEFGLRAVGDEGTYFQHVPWEKAGPNAETSYVAFVSPDGSEFRVGPGRGLGGQLGENSDRELELVHLVAESAEDVENAGLEGKAVLFIDESPRQERQSQRRGRGRRAFRGATQAYMALLSAQPAALITISDSISNEVRPRIGAVGGRNRVSSGRFRMPNSYTVSPATAERVTEALAKHDGKLKVKIHIEIEREPVFAANVIGLLEGSDPDLKHEIVGVGSHLDHVGVSRTGEIRNGADDDGSGTTGVLAVARAFSKNPRRPRRSILFMCFSGEENGLIGSRYYVTNPIFPNEEMVAEIQMDMIGRNEEFVDRRTGEVTEAAADNVNTLHLVGSQKLSKDLHNVCLAANEHVGFEFEYDEEDVFDRSDHANFARADIPIAFFFTGFHPQYHQPDDTVDKINFPKLARVAELAYAIAFECADREQRIVRDKKWSQLTELERRGR